MGWSLGYIKAKAPSVILPVQKDSVTQHFTQHPPRKMTHRPQERFSGVTGKGQEPLFSDAPLIQTLTLGSTSALYA